MTQTSAPRSTVRGTDLGPLRAGFAGEILTRADGERYDEARAVFNAMFDRRPAVIARATCDGDVVAALLFAQSERLPVAVRAGGHSAAGYSAIDDGLLLDLRPMKEISVDPVARRVRVGPGVTWGELDRATQEHGLATTGGRMTTTGVAGFVLGSGSGWLERMHGFACDNLVSARVVTADGRIVTASENEHPELFWGLRGGGGNFGVVTEFELCLHPVGPTIYGGMLMYPREHAADVCRHFRDVMQEAPREVAGGAILMTAPPAPFVPPTLRGRPAVTVITAYFGDLDHGPEALAALRGHGSPVVDTVGPMPYLALQALTDPGNPPGRRNYWTSDLFTDLPDEAIAAAVDRANAATSPASVTILAPYGGAVADVAEDAVPVGGRSARWFYHCYGIWTGGDDRDHVGWVKDTSAALRPWTAAGMALNFFSQVDDDRVRRTFGADKYRRLVAVKDEYDPGNVFRMNQNVRPSGRRA
ncbi:FAD-binding oxidoreductase [Pseudonocardia sp. C8]|uniref:FAD-binding oxidoreductase n=1 Tax=Pseudonocardia sp. C8 TaxID=2762759 RepID=UPI001642A2A3|nr:FAD-binding oxidoreductase [Pseudonocardia sp. C8]MBC3194314.1 FAD-binding oxidoreductase [Pseudonocardia sp. C8]